MEKLVQPINWPFLYSTPSQLTGLLKEEKVAQLKGEKVAQYKGEKVAQLKGEKVDQKERKNWNGKAGAANKLPRPPLMHRTYSSNLASIYLQMMMMTMMTMVMVMIKQTHLT